MRSAQTTDTTSSIFIRHGITLPPYIVGDQRGEIRVKIDQLVWRRPPKRAVSVFSQWWGEETPGVQFNVSSDPNSPKATTAVFPVTTNSPGLFSYLKDMGKGLELIVVDTDTSEAMGTAALDLSGLRVDNPIDGLFEVLAKGTEEVIAELRVLVLLTHMNDKRKPRPGSTTPNSVDSAQQPRLAEFHSKINELMRKQGHDLQRDMDMGLSSEITTSETEGEIITGGRLPAPPALGANPELPSRGLHPSVHMQEDVGGYDSNITTSSSCEEDYALLANFQKSTTVSHMQYQKQIQVAQQSHILAQQQLLHSQQVQVMNSQPQQTIGGNGPLTTADMSCRSNNTTANTTTTNNSTSSVEQLPVPKQHLPSCTQNLSPPPGLILNKKLFINIISSQNLLPSNTSTESRCIYFVFKFTKSVSTKFPGNVTKSQLVTIPPDDEINLCKDFYLPMYAANSHVVIEVWQCGGYVKENFLGIVIIPFASADSKNHVTDYVVRNPVSNQSHGILRLHTLLVAPHEPYQPPPLTNTAKTSNASVTYQHGVSSGSSVQYDTDSPSSHSTGTTTSSLALHNSGPHLHLPVHPVVGTSSYLHTSQPDPSPQAAVPMPPSNGYFEEQATTAHHTSQPHHIPQNIQQTSYLVQTNAPDPAEGPNCSASNSSRSTPSMYNTHRQEGTSMGPLPPTSHSTSHSTSTGTTPTNPSSASSTVSFAEGNPDAAIVTVTPTPDINNQLTTAVVPLIRPVPSGTVVRRDSDSNAKPAGSWTLAVNIHKALHITMVSNQSDFGNAYPPSCFVTYELQGREVDPNTKQPLPVIQVVSDSYRALTHVIHKSCAPVWSCTQQMTVNPNYQVEGMVFKLWHNPNVNSDTDNSPAVDTSLVLPAQLLGSAYADLTGLKLGMGNVEGWYHIHSSHEGNHQSSPSIGQLYVGVGVNKPNSAPSIFLSGSTSTVTLSNFLSSQRTETPLSSTYRPTITCSSTTETKHIWKIPCSTSASSGMDQKSLPSRHVIGMSEESGSSRAHSPATERSTNTYVSHTFTAAQLAPGDQGTPKSFQHATSPRSDTSKNGDGDGDTVALYKTKLLSQMKELDSLASEWMHRVTDSTPTTTTTTHERQGTRQKTSHASPHRESTRSHTRTHSHSHTTHSHPSDEDSASYTRYTRSEESASYTKHIRHGDEEGASYTRHTHHGEGGAVPPPQLPPPSSNAPSGSDNQHEYSVDESVECTTPDRGRGGGGIGAKLVRSTIEKRSTRCQPMAPLPSRGSWKPPPTTISSTTIADDHYFRMYRPPASFVQRDTAVSTAQPRGSTTSTDRALQRVARARISVTADEDGNLSYVPMSKFDDDNGFTIRLHTKIPIHTSSTTKTLERRNSATPTTTAPTSTVQVLPPPPESLQPKRETKTVQVHQEVRRHSVKEEHATSPLRAPRSTSAGKRIKRDDEHNSEVEPTTPQITQPQGKRWHSSLPPLTIAAPPTLITKASANSPTGHVSSLPPFPINSNTPSSSCSTPTPPPRTTLSQPFALLPDRTNSTALILMPSEPPERQEDLATNSPSPSGLYRQHHSRTPSPFDRRLATNPLPTTGNQLQQQQSSSTPLTWRSTPSPRRQHTTTARGESFVMESSSGAHAQSTRYTAPQRQVSPAQPSVPTTVTPTLSARYAPEESSDPQLYSEATSPRRITANTGLIRKQDVTPKTNNHPGRATPSSASNRSSSQDRVMNRENSISREPASLEAHSPTSSLPPSSPSPLAASMRTGGLRTGPLQLQQHGPQGHTPQLSRNISPPKPITNNTNITSSKNMSSDATTTPTLHSQPRHNHTPTSNQQSPALKHLNLAGVLQPPPKATSSSSAITPRSCIPGYLPPPRSQSQSPPRRESPGQQSGDGEPSGRKGYHDNILSQPNLYTAAAMNRRDRCNNTSVDTAGNGATSGEAAPQVNSSTSTLVQQHSKPPTPPRHSAHTQQPQTSMGLVRREAASIPPKCQAIMAKPSSPPPSSGSPTIQPSATHEPKAENKKPSGSNEPQSPPQIVRATVIGSAKGQLSKSGSSETSIVPTVPSSSCIRSESQTSQPGEDKASLCSNRQQGSTGPPSGPPSRAPSSSESGIRLYTITPEGNSVKEDSTTGSTTSKSNTKEKEEKPGDREDSSLKSWNNKLLLSCSTTSLTGKAPVISQSSTSLHSSSSTTTSSVRSLGSTGLMHTLAEVAKVGFGANNAADSSEDDDDEPTATINSITKNFAVALLKGAPHSTSASIFNNANTTATTAAVQATTKQNTIGRSLPAMGGELTYQSGSDTDDTLPSTTLTPKFARSSMLQTSSGVNSQRGLIVGSSACTTRQTVTDLLSKTMSPTKKMPNGQSTRMTELLKGLDSTDDELESSVATTTSAMDKGGVSGRLLVHKFATKRTILSKTYELGSSPNQSSCDEPTTDSTHHSSGRHSLRGMQAARSRSSSTGPRRRLGRRGSITPTSNFGPSDTSASSASEDSDVADNEGGKSTDDEFGLGSGGVATDYVTQLRSKIFQQLEQIGNRKEDMSPSAQSTASTTQDSISEI